MAANQKTSAQNGEKPTKNERQKSPRQNKADDLPMTKRDALAIFSSGVRTCQDAGIQITHKVYQGYVLLAIPESEITASDDGILFVPIITGTD